MKPKEESSHFQHKEQLTLLERILRELNVDNLSLIRKSFYSYNNAVTMPEFVKIMRAQLHWDKSENEGENVEGALEEWGEYSSYYRDKNHEGLEKWMANANFGGKKNKEDVAKVMQLCEVFSAVDVDNSGDISWQEFTSYVIKNGVHVLKPIKPYHRAELMNPINGNNIDRIVYLRPIDKLLVFDESKYARIYKPEREKFTEEYSLVKELDCGSKVVNAVYVGNQQVSVIRERDSDEDSDSDKEEVEVEANYAPRTFGVGSDQGVVTCGSMLVWDCGVVWRLKGEIARPAASIPTYSNASSLFTSKTGMEFSPLSMCYSSPDNTMFVGTQTGTIHAWTFSSSPVPLRGSARTPTMWKSRERVLQQAHTDMVMDLTEVKNTRMIASSSLDADICLWDTHLMSVTSRLKGHLKGVLATAYSADFRILVSCGFDRDALVWNPMVNHSLYRLKGHYSSLIGVRSVENTPQFITADKMGTMKIWDIRTFECVQTLSLENKGITNFDSVGSRILLAAPKSVLCLEAEKPKNPTLTEESNLLYCGYNDQHGTILTAAGLDVKLWDGKTGLLQKSYDKISSHPISAVCMDDAQRKIFVGNTQGSVGIHHYDNGTLINMLESHVSEISVLLYLPHKHALLAISYDGKARLHDAHAASAVAQTYNEPNSTQAPTQGSQSFPTQAEPTRRGGEQTARKVHDREGRARSVLKTARFQQEICCATYSSVLNLVACASKDCIIRIWDPDRWGMEAQLNSVQDQLQNDSEEEAEIMCMAFLEPYPVLVCGDSTGVLTFFSVRPSLYKNQLLVRVDALTAVSSSAISFTKNKTFSTFTVSTPLSSGGVSKNSRVGGIYSLAFSPEHKTVYTGTESGDILGWSLDTLFQKGDMRPHEPKKKNSTVTLETHAYTKPALVPEDIEIIHWWKAHSDVVTCLSVLGTGNGVLSGSKDKRVRAWGCDGNYHGTLRQVTTDEDWSLPVDTKSVHTNLIKTASTILHSIKLSPLTIPVATSPETSPLSSPSSPPLFPTTPHTRRAYESAKPAPQLSPTARRPASPLRHSSPNCRSPTSTPVPNFPFFSTVPPSIPPITTPSSPFLLSNSATLAVPGTPTHPNLESLHLSLPSYPLARPRTPTHPSLASTQPRTPMSPSLASFRPTTPSSPIRPRTPLATTYSPSTSVRPSTPTRPKSPTSRQPPATTRPSTPTRPPSPLPNTRISYSPQSPLNARPSTPNQSPSNTSRPSTPNNNRPQSASPNRPSSSSGRPRSPLTTSRPRSPASPITPKLTNRSMTTSPIPTTPKANSPAQSPVRIPSLSHLTNRQQQAALRLSLALESLDTL